MAEVAPATPTGIEFLTVDARGLRLGELLTVDDVAQRLDVEPKSVTAYLARGHLIGPDAVVRGRPVWGRDRFAAWLNTRPRRFRLASSEVDQ